MRYLFISLCAAFFCGCQNTSEPVSVKELIANVSEGKDSFVEIPFSTLKRLNSLDSTEFQDLLKNYGYSQKNSILFATQSTFESVGDTINQIGIGRFFLHSIPTIVKIGSEATDDGANNTVYYSFPIKYLASYKYAMLQGKDQFFKVLDQEAKFDDLLKVNYVSEKYFDIIAKLEYKYYVASDYVMLTVSRRTYL